MLTLSPHRLGGKRCQNSNRLGRWSHRTFLTASSSLLLSVMPRRRPCNYNHPRLTNIMGAFADVLVAVATTSQQLEAFCNLLGRCMPRRTTAGPHRGRPDLPVVADPSLAPSQPLSSTSRRAEATQNLIGDQYANNTSSGDEPQTWKISLGATGLQRGPTATKSSHRPTRLRRHRTTDQVSVERGLGPATLKDAFIVEDLAATTSGAGQHLHMRHKYPIGPTSPTTASSLLLPGLQCRHRPRQETRRDHHVQRRRLQPEWRRHQRRHSSVLALALALLALALALLLLLLLLLLLALLLRALEGPLLHGACHVPPHGHTHIYPNQRHGARILDRQGHHVEDLVRRRLRPTVKD